MDVSRLIDSNQTRSQSPMKMSILSSAEHAPFRDCAENRPIANRESRYR